MNETGLASPSGAARQFALDKIFPYTYIDTEAGTLSMITLACGKERIMLKAVIFDVDGTLLDTERIYIRAWKEAGRELGYEIPDDVLFRTRAIQKEEAARIFESSIGNGFSYKECQLLRVPIAEKLILEESPLVLPGVREMLFWLKKHGIKRAVATSTDQEKTKLHLSLSGIAEEFEGMVTGDMVEHGKPAPDIFLKAAELLGEDPEGCVVFEDSYAGIKASCAAGIRGIFIPNVVPVNDEVRANAYAQLPSMNEAISCLEELL